ncbi:DUF2637 domain-containing protein [Mycolicibacter virginiensis]|uniref:DUF2637 domain-containing protein n=1 Tax=Mycolicibacter virginiensis TaxID=1795032 RepID=UPI001F04A72B|nr:DUF2637 domain-containing protein [Mycolicibacter virginiensis]ULP48053.1 DUF2637 domain-containing protein [Mycolicibacter virginiensis]
MTFRKWFMWVLLGSTAASLAGNIAAATLLPHGGAALPTAVVIAVASVAPLALPVAVHSVPVAARAAGGVRAVVVVSVAVVSLAAFAMSFDALAQLAHAAGHSGWVGALLPVTLDVLAAASAVALVLDPAVATVAAPVADGHDVAAPPTDPAAEPVTGAVAAARTSAGLHLVAGPGDRDMDGSDQLDGTPMTSADVHIGRAQELVAAGVVKAPAPTVAAALAGLADGGSLRAVAASTGLHRTSVSRLAAAAEEAVSAG